MVIKPLTLWLLRNLTMRHGEYIWRTPYGEPVTSWPPITLSWRKHMKAKASVSEPLSPRGVLGMLIPVAHIESSPMNPRKHFDEAQLQELAASVKANGVVQAVVVRPKYAPTPSFWEEPERFPAMHYELVAGERRWRAAQLAGLDTIPATVRDLTDAQVLEIQVVENEQRADLSPLEKARGYQALLAMPEFKEEGVKLLAQKVGKSAATIYGLIKLLELPDNAKKAVESGKLAMSTAQLIARVPNEKARKELAADATREGWDGSLPSYRGIKQRIQNTLMIELKQAPFSQSDETLSPAAGTCDACPKRTGNNRTDYPEGRADVCTDPSCYRGKLEVHRKRTLEAARDDGLKVLTGKEAEKALGYDSAYYDLKSQPWQDKKNRSFKQLLAGELDDKRVLIVDAKGERHFLVPKKDANEAIKKKHKITLGFGPASVEDQAERRKRMDAGKARRLKERALLKAIAEKAEERFRQAGMATTDPVVNDLLREECKRVIQATWSNMRDLMWPRHGAKGRAGEMTQHMLQVIQPLTAPALLAVLVESAAARSIDAPNGPWKTLGIDRKTVEREAAEQAKAPKPSANGHAAKAAPLERWVINYQLRDGAKDSLLFTGWYKDACAKALAMPNAKRVLSCQTLTEDEYNRRSAERFAQRGKKKPSKKETVNDVNDLRGIFAKGVGKPQTLLHMSDEEIEQAADEGDKDRRIDEEDTDAATNGKADPPSFDQLEKATIIGQFQGKMKKLATCMPVELEGRKWCCLGSEHRYGVGKFKLAPLYSLSEWKTTFGGDVRTYRSPNWPGADSSGPAADLQRKRAYEGVLLTVRGETYVIGHGRRELVSKDPDYAGPPLDATSIDNADGDVARCCVCGCTEDSPCPGGCYWVEGDDMEDRCNRCVGKPIPRAEGEGREASKYDPTKDPHAPLALFGIVTKAHVIYRCSRLKLEACAALAGVPGVSQVAAQEIGARLKESVRELQETPS
jgi:ParB/RepB/Spo0J family partition protein